MAKRYNMRLVLKQRFSEFFQQKVKKEHHRSLMMKMMALEVRLALISLHLFLHTCDREEMSVSAVSL